MMRAGSLATAAILIAAASGSAQTPRADSLMGWNSAAARQLIGRATERRAQPRRDTALRSYSAKASGHVYFYLDRQDTTEQTLVKVDQIALELYWAAPNLTKQRIVGLRDVDRLPNRMYYHLDHLTVVQNGFGNLIRLGDGDEVRDVPHPAAIGSDTVYDYLIADSLSLTFPPQPPVRVYEVQVRPRRTDRSGMIGSLFIDQASADIVRMTFTFTPASYVDRRLDYINISLDNGLWIGSYWLPNEQSVEIRRQIPELDFAAGAVIKGRLRVYGYEFNQPFSRNFFYGRSVEAAPEADRKAFAFEEDIYAGLDREELATPPQMENLRARALELAKRRTLSGLPPLRLFVPNASSVLRYNSVEGVSLGAGLTYMPNTLPRYDATFGYAFGANSPHATMTARWTSEHTRTGWVRGYYRELRDIGVRPGLPGVLNTASMLFDDRDYLTPYFSTGVEVGTGANILGGALRIAAGFERHRAETVTRGESGPAFRTSLAAVNPGSLRFLRANVDVPLFESDRLSARGTTELEWGLFKPDHSTNTSSGRASFVRPVVGLLGTYTSPGRSTTVLARASGGKLLGGTGSNPAPFQQAFLLGRSEERRVGQECTP